MNYELNDHDYHEIAAFVHGRTGINLFDGKKELIQARLSKRLRALGFDNFTSYVKFALNDGESGEVLFFLDALATNLTSFFREPQHFHFLAKKFLPELESQRRQQRSRRLRLWSAACSSGEEAYTMAMVVLENSPYLGRGGDFKILGTDLSTKVLAVARKGLYTADRVSAIPPAALRAFFQKGQGRFSGWYRVRDELRELCTFSRLNLMDDWPFKQRFDAVFCRNVMIYFDKPTIAKLVGRIHNILEPGGCLFIGHSESLSGIQHPFQYVDASLYRKV